MKNLDLMYELIQTHANEKEQIQFYDMTHSQQNPVVLNEKIVVSDNELENSENGN